MASYKVENIESVDELLDNNTNEDVGIEPMIFAPDEPRVTINERILEIPDELKTIGVENDNNVERIYFEIPRYFDEVNDLSEFTIYINYLNANQEPNKYHCTDVEVEGENIVFSWLTSEHVYSYRGTVRFIVYAVASDNRKWNSTVAELFVMEGLETEEQIIDNNPDIIDELINMKSQVEEALQRIDEQQDVIDAQQSTISSQQTTITNQQNKITQQQEQIDDAIDVIGDYEIVQEDPVQIRFKKGNGTFGDTVNLGDNLASKSMVNAGYDTYSGNSYSGSASDYGIKIAKASGAYEQEGTPTPESPIEPKFFEPKHVNTNGGNLFDASKLQTKSQGGATVTNNGDGSFTISGSGTLSSSYNNYFRFTNEETKKLIKTGKKLYLNNVFNLLPIAQVIIRSNENTVIKILEGTDGISSVDIAETEFDNGEYLEIRFYGGSGSSIKTGTIKPILYQDGDGTWYPYNADSTPLDITLRALPNGVCDTYENGVITRRVGEIEFDGSSDEIWSVQHSPVLNNAKCFFTEISGKKKGAIDNLICNKMKLKYNGTSGVWQIDEVFICSGNTSTTYATCYFNFPSDITSLGLLKTYLQSNPLTVWYELAEPYTEQVDLPVIPSYYPYTNAWHDSEVEASGLTWNILTQSKSNENKINDLQDEIGVVNKRFEAKQLLINPDFQVNQRGQSEYIGIEYSVDCWRPYVAGVSVLTPLKGGGIKFESKKVDTGGLNQWIDISNYLNKSLTLVTKMKCNKNRKLYIDVVTNFGDEGLQVGAKKVSLTTEFQVFSLTFNITQEIIDSNNGKIVVRPFVAQPEEPFNADDVIYCDYCDLWEGDIAYPHVKEDEAIALMKCQRRVLPTASTVMGYTGNDSRYVYIMCEKLKSMIDTPTVTGFTEFVLKIDGVSKNITINGAVANVETGEICLDVGSGNLESNRNISGFMNTLILSCEQL